MRVRERAIGTGVFGGMLGGTFLGIFFIPLFFVVVQRMFHSVRETPAPASGASAADADVHTGAAVPSEEPRYGGVYHRPAGDSPHGA